MPELNTVIEVGNATREPELKELPSGTIVSEFGLAVNRRWPDRDNPGEWKEDTSFFDVSCFSKLGENVAETVQKGTRVVVVGRLKHDTWETPEGDKRSKVRIVAHVVAPSLEWATASVTKNPKSNGSDSAPDDEIDKDF